MLYYFGGIVAYYMLYSLCALIFKHKVGFVVSIIFMTVAGICSAVMSSCFVTLVGAIVGGLLVGFIKKIQIRSHKDSVDQ